MKRLAVIAILFLICGSPAHAQPTCSDQSSPFQCYQAGLDLVGATVAQFKKDEDSLKQQIQDLTKALDLALPKGAVVAFDSATGCPGGWAPYTDAISRTIVGASLSSADAHGLTFRPPRSTGGEENHVLTVNEIPPHEHRVYRHAAGEEFHVGAPPPPGFVGGAGSADNYTFVKDTWMTGPTGGGQAHNTMPPYVALFYCIRN
jgi:hypothetical protein